MALAGRAAELGPVAKCIEMGHERRTGPAHRVAALPADRDHLKVALRFRDLAGAIDTTGADLALRSERVAIGTSLALPGGCRSGATPQLKFRLPDSSIDFEIKAEVAWADFKGLAGLRFRHVPAAAQAELEQWLDDRMEEEFPGSKDRLASEAESFD